MPEKENASSFSINEMLEMVVRRKILFLIPFVFVFIAAIGVGAFMPRVYETSSLVQVKNKRMIDPLVKDIAVAPDLRGEIDTLSKQILSWPKMEQLVAQLNLIGEARTSVAKEDYIKELRKRVRVEVRANDIIEIAYQDQSPSIAQKVVNTITNNFIAENTRIKREEASNAIDFINEQLAIYRKKLESSEQDFSENQIDSQMRTLQNHYSILRDSLSRLQKIIPSQVTTEQSPVVSQLRARHGQLESELNRVLIDAKEGNPKVAALRYEIASVKERISQEMENRSVKESISTVNPAFIQTEQELKRVTLEMEYLRQRKANLVKRAQTPARQVSDEELKNIERSKRVDEDIYQMLLRQLESAYVSERLQDSEKGDRFSVIEYARVPLRPIKPNMPKVIGMGFIGGLALGFGLVFMVENMVKSFQTVEQAKNALSIPLIGYVSHFAVEQAVKKVTFISDIKEWINSAIEKKESLSKMRFVSSHNAKKLLNPSVTAQAVIYHEPKSKISEEIRVIRTGLFEGIRDAVPPQVLLVTSSLRGEGKSTTSLNIAIAQADNGKKTLLIDADLRRGGLHSLLSLPASPGLSELLSSNSKEINAIQTTIIPNLSVITSGKRQAKPSELLGVHQLKDIIGTYRGVFDTIILDAPPVLSLPDVSVLSKCADGVVMIIQSSRTRRKDVDEALALLTKISAPVLGFVLTGVRYFMPRYMYDYYYYEND